MTFSVLIVGLGQIGMGYDLKLDPAKFALTHARGFAQHDAFQLAGGVDPSAARRNLFEANYKAPVFADVRSAVEKLQPSVVVVASPTDAHCATVREIMKAGRPKAVLCEKPLAYEMGEARELVDLCAAQGCRLFVNYMRRSDRGTAEIQRRLDDGSIGVPEKAVVWYSKGIFNNGSHFLNLLQYWLGDVTEFQVVAPGRLWDGRDPEPDVALTFARGTKAYFLAAREENYSHYTMEFVAANGRLRYERGGEEVLWQKTTADPAVEGYTVLDIAAETIPTGLAQAQWHVADQLAEELNGRPGRICTGSEALRTLKTLVAIKAKR